MIEPYDDSFYRLHVSGSLASARTMLPLLFQYYQPQSAIDVGCGLGPWLQAAMELGTAEILGLDGDYIDRNMLVIPEANFRAADLQGPLRVDRRFDLAISMEVAEHLPFERSASFVDDLVALSDVVLFSTALPYQGGTDHINEQWLEFWAILFQKHGYVPYDFLRRPCWNNKAVEFWYSQNAIVFCTAEKGRTIFPDRFRASGSALSMPHPLTFLVNVARYRPLSATALDPEWKAYESVLRAYESGDGTLPQINIADATDAGGRPLFPASRITIEDADAKIEEYKLLAADSTERIASLNSEIAALRHEVSALRNSLSWRVTEPARRSLTWLSRLKADKKP